MYSKDKVCLGEGNMKNQIRAGQDKMGHSRQNGQVVKYIKLRNTSYVLIFKWNKKIKSKNNK